MIRPLHIVFWVALLACSANAQTPRLFLVPHGMNPATTTPGVPAQVEVVAGSSVVLDVFVEVRGGSLPVTGAQFEMPCQIGQGAESSMFYVANSVVSDGLDLPGNCDASWVEQRAPGACPIDRPGALAAGPSNSPCTLSVPELIGSITYSIPYLFPVSDSFLVVPTIAHLTNQNQVDFPNLQVDGVQIRRCQTCASVPVISSWGVLILILWLMASATVILRRGETRLCPDSV